MSKTLAFKLSIALTGVMNVTEADWKEACSEIREALLALQETGSVDYFQDRGFHLAQNVLDECDGDVEMAAEVFLMRTVTIGIRKDILKEMPREYEGLHKLQCSVSLVPKSGTLMKATEEVSE